MNRMVSVWSGFMLLRLMTEIRDCMKKTRKMLSDWKAPYIQSLMRLIETQSKATLAIWAVNYSEQFILPLWCKYYPDDMRPQNALIAARDWLLGKIKLPQAKATILECHSAARDAEETAVAQVLPGRLANAHRPFIQHVIVSGLPFMEHLQSPMTGLEQTLPGKRLSYVPPKNVGKWKPHCATLLWRSSRTLQKSTGNVDCAIAKTKNALIIWREAKYEDSE